MWMGVSGERRRRWSTSGSRELSRRGDSHGGGGGGGGVECISGIIMYCEHGRAGIMDMGYMYDLYSGWFYFLLESTWAGRLSYTELDRD